MRRRAGLLSRPCLLQRSLPSSGRPAAPHAAQAAQMQDPVQAAPSRPGHAGCGLCAARQLPARTQPPAGCARAANMPHSASPPSRWSCPSASLADRRASMAMLPSRPLPRPLCPSHPPASAAARSGCGAVSAGGGAIGLSFIRAGRRALLPARWQARCGAVVGRRFRRGDHTPRVEIFARAGHP